MKAAIFRGSHNIDVINMDSPIIENNKDAIVSIDLTSICGTDLHMYHGKIPFEKGHVLGHEFVGTVENVGSEVKNIKPGDKVFGTSTIFCGECFYCKLGLYSECDNANFHRSTAYFGGPEESGGYQGTQAEYIRVPYADNVLYKIPEGITDEQALILSDILPTGYFGADMAEIKPGESVVIYGAGPVGQMAALSARLMGAEKIYIVDNVPSRLSMAKNHAGAETINYKEVDPVDEIIKRTNGYGADKAIEAVGLEADTTSLEKFEETLGLEDSSGQTLRWAVQSVRKGGVISIIGVFSGMVDNFPIGTIQSKNLTLRAGNCPHKKYLDILVQYIQEGKLDPTFVLTHKFNLDEIGNAYITFDKNKNECIKEIITV